MSDEKNILLLNYHSKETEKAIELFEQLQQHDITIAENLKDVAEKANENYDLIITGYVVPAVSDDRTLSCFEDIDKSIKEFETSLMGKKIPARIEKESQETKAQIIQILNDRIRGFEIEKIEIHEKLENMKKVTAAALNAQEETEKKADATVKDVEKKADIAVKDAEKRADAAVKDAEKRAEDAVEKKKDAEKKAGAAVKDKENAEKRANAAVTDKEEAEKKADAAVKAAVTDKEEAEKKADAAVKAAAAVKEEAEKKADAAVKAAATVKEDAEKRVAAAEAEAKTAAEKTKLIERLNSDFNRLNEQLKEAEAKVQQSEIEQGKIQRKLDKLQEAWENYAS